MTSAISSRIGRAGLRWVTAVSVAFSLALAAAPAQAATAQTSHLRAAAAPATVLVNTPLVIAGAISPSVKGKPVYLQRLIAGKWKTIGHVPSGARGVYSFTVKAKGKPGLWALRVMRPANSVAKAIVGKTLKVRLTKTAYKVTMAAVSKVNAGSPLVITGAVTPKTTGQVVLQYVKAGKWATLATGSAQRLRVHLHQAGARQRLQAAGDEAVQRDHRHRRQQVRRRDGAAQGDGPADGLGHLA